MKNHLTGNKHAAKADGHASSVMVTKLTPAEKGSYVVAAKAAANAKGSTNRTLSAWVRETLNAEVERLREIGWMD